MQTINKNYLLAILIFCIFSNISFAQYSLNKLEKYDPFSDIDTIRTVIKGNFSKPGVRNSERLKRLEKKINEALQTKDSLFIGENKSKIGDIYFEIGNYSKAIAFYRESQQFFEINHDTVNAVFTQLKISNAHYFADVNAYSDYLKDALNRLKKIKSPQAKALYKFYLGFQESDASVKEDYFLEALSMQEEIVKRNPTDIEAKKYLARFYNASGNYVKAIELAEETNSFWNLVLYLNNYSHHKVLEKNYSEALKIVKRSLKICKEERFLTLLRNTYENIGGIYRLQGNISEALHYYQLMKFVTEALYEETFSNQIAEQKVVHDIEKKELENKFLKREQAISSKQIKLQKYFIVTLFVLLSIIAVVLFLVYKSRIKLKKANSILDSKKDELNELNLLLEENEGYLNEAQKIAKLANWEIDFTKHSLKYSEHFPQILNYEFSELQNFLSYITSITSTNDKEKISIFFDKDNQKLNFIEIKIDFNNSEKWLRLIRKINNGNDQILKINGTIQDISDHKKEEEAIIKLEEQKRFNEKLIQYQEEERKRIAGEIHDGLGQEILLIKNRALLGLQNKIIDDNLKKQFTEIDKLSSIVLDTTKEIAFNLRPAHLERLGLTDTIIATLEQSGATSKTDYKFNIEQIDNRLSKENEIHLFRIIQEAVNNILKHSDAINSFVEIKNDNNRILVTITDDGKGIENSKKEKSKGSFGLRNMISRVQMLNGEIEIKSNDPNGTKIKISIPMENYEKQN